LFFLLNHSRLNQNNGQYPLGGPTSEQLWTSDTYSLNNHFDLSYIMSEKKLGSILTAGGGIAGMQAALDLANSGYYVYLLEKNAAIGGVMSQLDKTFPTNDCTM